jgi:hypothetical protein
VFRRHRDDLLAAQENERIAMNKVITVLADQVEWLRWQLNKAPHMSPALRDLHMQTAPVMPTPDTLEGFDPNFVPYMTEEEEEMLALRINDHITDLELEALRGEVAKVIPLFPTPDLDPTA